MNLPKPEAILFDWDNTLVDTWPIIHRSLQNTFAAMGREPWTMEETRARVSRSLRDSFPELFGDKWEEAGEIYGKSYRSLHLSGLAAMPHAADLLKHASQAGIYMAVVSNKQGKTLREEAAHMGWNGFFSKLVGALDTPRDKPHPEPLIASLEGSALKPGAHVWFVGDTLVDMECALATGCTPVFYGSGVLPAETRERVFSFPCHSEIRTMLAKHV